MLWIMIGRSYATCISANPSISTRCRHFVPTANEVARRSIDGSRWSGVSRLISICIDSTATVVLRAKALVQTAIYDTSTETKRVLCIGFADSQPLQFHVKDSLNE